MALFAVLMLVEVLKELDVRVKKFFMFFFAFGVFMYNWFSFVDLFLNTSLLDPISSYLLALRRYSRIDQKSECSIFCAKTNISPRLKGKAA